MKEQKQNQTMKLNDLKKDDIINLQLKKSSSYYNDFLKEFCAIVISATNDNIVIKSPIKNDVLKEWLIYKDEILLLVKL